MSYLGRRSGEPESELWLSRKRRAKVIRVQWSSGAITLPKR